MIGEHAIAEPIVEGRSRDRRPLLVMAVALAVNAIVALRGFMYADDYRGNSLGALYGWSTEWLIEWHRSHFSPLDRAHFTVFVQVAPLEQWFAVLVMSLELAAALALTWLLAIRLMERRWALVALAAFGLSPLLIATNAWLIQAISLYGVVIGTNLAAIALVRQLESPRRLWLAMGAAGWLLGALTWETWLVGPPTLALLAVFWLAQGTALERVTWAWRAGRSFWIVTALMITGYLGVWKLGGYGTGGVLPSVGALVAAVWKALYALVMPGSVGGPWAWFAGEHSYSPIGVTPVPLIAIVAIGFGVLSAHAFHRNRLHTIQGLILLLVPAGLAALMAAVGRLDAFPASTPLEPRYVAPGLAFTAIGLARLLQTALGGQSRSAWKAPALSLLVVLLSLGWVATISRFVDIWGQNPGQGYVAAAKPGIAELTPASGIFDAEVPPAVMGRWFWPYNTTKELFRPLILDANSRFGAADSALMFTSSGSLVPARFYPLTWVALQACVPLTAGSPTTFTLPRRQIHLANLTLRVEVRATGDAVLDYTTNAQNAEAVSTGTQAHGTITAPAGSPVRFELLKPYAVESVDLTLHKGSACVASVGVGQPAP